MSAESAPEVAIVDYQLGNLYSVKHACEHVGLRSVISSDPSVIRRCDAVILPGVGAFADAMENLNRFGLSDALRELTGSDKPIIGICLGLQLLFSESFEFGQHQGLGVIPGKVVKLRTDVPGTTDKVKVPQVGWNTISIPESGRLRTWKGTLLDGVSEGEYMYFVHSFYVLPDDTSVVCSETTYGGNQFCSSVHYKNIFACQFHPERSGQAGLTLYKNLRAHIKK